MVSVQSEIRRAFLRSLHRGAKANALTMSAALDAFQAGGYAAVKTGRLIVNTSGGGYNTAFEIPRTGSQITQEQVLALSELFFSVLSDALISLGINDEQPENRDDIFNEMMADDRMNSVTRFGNDYTALRC